MTSSSSADEDVFRHLTQEQQHLVLEFTEVTQLNDINLCISILQENNWNLSIAIQNYLTGGSSGSGGIGTSNYNSNSSSRSATPGFGTHQVADSDNRRVHGISGYVYDVLRWLFQSYPESMAPDQDSIRFAREMIEQYGENGPRFEETSYSRAVSKGFRESKFLFVYLHSPLHDDTTKFCRSVLFSENVANLLNNDTISWGGSIWDAEAYNLSLQLRISAFPAAVLLMCTSERAVKIVDKISGFVDEEAFLARIRSAFNSSGAYIANARFERQQREEAVSLRAQQDREYQEALEADRKRIEQQRLEEEERLRQLEREAQERELKEAIELSQNLEKESVLAKRREAIKNNNELQNSNAPTLALIRFQLPQGAKISRKFDKDDQIQMIYDYLYVYFADNNSPTKNFMVSTNFPKQDLIDKTISLEKAGLFPRGALFVQDLDI